MGTARRARRLIASTAMSRTPVLLSWSGGKDAAWALHTLRARDDVEVVGLVTLEDVLDEVVGRI